jgi:predicted aminopeptidase
LASGQLDILFGREDIAEVLQAGRVGEEQARKLRLIADAKEFGETVMGLTQSSNYTTYYDTGGRPVSYVVSACRRDRFESHIWWFPIVGSLPYKGFFALEDARREARSMEASGYDVTVRTVAAYSTLGWFSDPVFSGMLRHDDVDLVALILHELTHGTVFAGGHGDWNEGLATFTGQEGALQFYRRKYGEGSPEWRRAADRLADEEAVDAFTRRIHGRLDRLYRSGLPESDTLTLREQTWAEGREEFDALRRALKGGGYEGQFNGRINNADLVARLRYGRYHVFRRTFAAAENDWTAFFARMREAAAQPDPFKALD